MSKLIETIKKHAVEVAGCWEWHGAMQMCGATPVMRWEGKTGAVRRYLAIELGLDLRGGRLATCKCGNWICVNPDHVQTVSRRQLQLRVVKHTKFNTNPVRMMRIAEQARKRSKINMEIAQQIREAEGVQREIAKQYGVSQYTVSCIKRGKTWRDYTNPFTALMKGLFK